LHTLFDLAIGVSTIGFEKAVELMERKMKASGLSCPDAATEGGGVGEPFEVAFKEVKDLYLYLFSGAARVVM
jgi:hypothetical protein